MLVNKKSYISFTYHLCNFYPSDIYLIMVNLAIEDGEDERFLLRTQIDTAEGDTIFNCINTDGIIRFQHKWCKHCEICYQDIRLKITNIKIVRNRLCHNGVNITHNDFHSRSCYYGQIDKIYVIHKW